MAAKKKKTVNPRSQKGADRIDRVAPKSVRETQRGFEWSLNNKLRSGKVKETGIDQDWIWDVNSRPPSYSDFPDRENVRKAARVGRWSDNYYGDSSSNWIGDSTFVTGSQTKNVWHYPDPNTPEWDLGPRWAGETVAPPPEWATPAQWANVREEKQRRELYGKAYKAYTKSILREQARELKNPRRKK